MWYRICFLFAFLLQLEYERKKKEEGKRARADKQQVLDMLFSAFEKHQYYNIKDLVDITKQPVVRLEGKMGAVNADWFQTTPLATIQWRIFFVNIAFSQTERELWELLISSNLNFFLFQIYLKEILRDIGIYNVKGTHKNTWELRPEYRHYQAEEKTDE